jgi:hypothetical protein
LSCCVAARERSGEQHFFPLAKVRQKEKLKRKKIENEVFLKVFNSQK